ncbi:MAG: holo-ACP synthase [Solirubrobacterales bacterium]|nr:holo-ACP synthase [Solirubrobacterales bacterium]OJU93496.1 MAG: holo-[acyl-carrier-protein] synthase [Solirubrobacterales bacterium 67-14]
MADGVGMDLIEVARIERALDRHPRLADRLFTEGELQYAASKGRPGRHLAARFAAKEAVVKALRLGPGTSLREIEVVAGDERDPAPQIRLSGRVRDQADSRGLSVQVSLTHAREMAGAVAIAESA